jgi:head-tail adaptor
VARVHQEASAHKVHVWWTNTNGTTNETRYVRYTLANDGTLTLDSGSSIVLGAYSDRFIAGMDAAKNLYVAYGGSLRFKKASYAAGAWTWGAEEVPGLGLSINLNTLGNAVIPSSGIFYMTLRDSGGSTRVIQRTAAGAWSIIHTIASTTGNPVLGLDQLENVLLGYATATGVFYKKLTVSSGTWSSAVSIDTATTANYLSTTAAMNGTSFDLLYMTGTASPYSIVFNTVVLNQAPLTPDGLAPNGTGRDAVQAITLTATAHDDAGDYPTDAQWQVTDGTTTWYVKSDGTLTAAATWVPTGGGSFLLSRVINAGQLTNGNAYQWRVMTRDQGGLTSPWSDYAAFSATAAPVTSIVVPASGATITTSQVTVTVSVSGSVGTVTYRLYSDVAGAKGALLRTETAAGTTKTIGYTLATGSAYWVEALATSPDSVVGAAVSQRFTVSFILPQVPTLIVVTKDTYNTIQVTNPAPTGGQPAVIGNTVYRREPGGSWSLLATVETNGSFDDYAVGSGRTYDYYVAAHGDNTTTANSATATTSAAVDVFPQVDKFDFLR